MPQRSSHDAPFVNAKGEVDGSGESVTVRLPRKQKRRRGWRERAGMIDYTFLARLELTGLESRTLMAIMAHVPARGGADAFCTMQEIADVLGVAQPSVARAIKGLRERQIVWSPRQGRWHVNTWLMYNGDFDSWNAEAEKDPEPIWVRGADTTTGEIK